MASFVDNCTATGSRCPRVFLAHEPSLAGNAIFLVLFAALVPVAFGLGLKYRSPFFATAITTGLALEAVGYIGRVLLHSDTADRNFFVLFLVGTVLGPTFVCVAVFLVMPRIVAIYGDNFRSWRPIWYRFLFYVVTTVVVMLELAGGIIAVMRDGTDDINTGIRLLVAGLAIQLVALVAFVGHAMLFAIAVRTRHHILDTKFVRIYSKRPYKAFIAAFSLATLLLIIRTAYRIIAIAEGFNSSIAQSETLMFALDGLTVLLAVLLLLVWFPGRILGPSSPRPAPRRKSKIQHSAKIPRSIQLIPYELPSTQSSPSFDKSKSKIKYPAMAHPANRSQQREASLQRNLVDSDTLW